MERREMAGAVSNFYSSSNKGHTHIHYCFFAIRRSLAARRGRKLRLLSGQGGIIQ
jgi:hypothetical protein